MIRLWKRSVLAFGFAVSALLTQNVYAVPIARLVLDSEAGDYIGQGKDFVITYPSGLFSSAVRRTIGPDNEPAELIFGGGIVTSGADNTHALLFFGTDQLGIAIQPGFFPDAQRADFAALGHPGLDITFQNRGCNTLTGEFTVHDVFFSDAALAATGSPIHRFSASFEQHCEGAAPALFGRFDYDAFELPEPGTLVLVIGLLPLLSLGRRRSLRKCCPSA